MLMTHRMIMTHRMPRSRQSAICCCCVRIGAWGAQVRRQNHFESNEKSANTTVESLLPILLEELEEVAGYNDVKMTVFTPFY